MKDVRSSLLLLLISNLPLLTQAQSGTNDRSFTPVVVGGFNHDVVAEGTGKNAKTVTSQEMDLIDPSNYVLCTEQFALANQMPKGYGLPNDGRLNAQNKSFQFEPYGTSQLRAPLNPNVLYLKKNEGGILRFDKPANFEKIAILGLATEGPATIDINLLFTDGTSRFSRGQVLPDWFDGPDAFFAGFGRIKRTSGASVPIYYDGHPSNPMMYVIELNVPANKTMFALQFDNVSNGDNPALSRAFIFAISGLAPLPPVVPTTQPTVTKEQINPPAVIPVVTPAEVKPAVTTAFSLRGKVTNEKTKSPVVAKISLIENQVTVNSGATGEYKIPLAAGGDFTVKIEAQGYISKLEKIKVAASPTGTEFNPILQPVEIGTTVNLKSVLFQVSTANLLEESSDELNMVVDMMKQNPSMTIDLAGHTDTRGNKNLNLKLSTDRVKMVRQYLVGKGIDGSRVTGKGYGGSKPIAKGKTEADQRLNRRVEFIVTKY